MCTSRIPELPEHRENLDTYQRKQMIQKRIACIFSAALRDTVESYLLHAGLNKGIPAQKNYC